MQYDFTEDWYGWKVRGNYLVSPDRQYITRERLEGLLWRDAMELRRASYQSRRKAEKRQQLVRVVVVDLAEVRHGGRFAG